MASDDTAQSARSDQPERLSAATPEPGNRSPEPETFRVPVPEQETLPLGTPATPAMTEMTEMSATAAPDLDATEFETLPRLSAAPGSDDAPPGPRAPRATLGPLLPPSPTLREVPEAAPVGPRAAPRTRPVAQSRPLASPAPLPAAPAAPAAQPPRRRGGIIAAGLGVLLIVAVVVGIVARTSTRPGGSTGAKATSTISTTGPNQWAHDTQRTPTNAQYTIYTQQHASVDPAFQAYYQQQGGAALLGTPLLPAYETPSGLVQIFAGGALLLPDAAATTTAPTVTGTATTGSTTGTATANAATTATTATTGTTPTTGTATVTTTEGSTIPAQVIGEGSTDAATGVVRVPLLHQLLTVGSEAPIGGAGGSLTYADLRGATTADKLVAVPIYRAEPSDTSANAVFIPEQQANGFALGHRIPLSIWSYINQSAVAPNGWEAALGLPLTEALPATIARDGATHHALVQAFWLGVVLVDMDTDDVGTNGQPTGEIVDTGADYLRTLGPLALRISSGAGAWATGDVAVVSAAGGSSAAVHLGLNSPLTLDGQARWVNGALWYGVAWKTVARSGSGWVPATAITPTAPAAGAPAWAAYDALSTSLQSYLAGLGNNVGSVIYDITRNQYYTYNPNEAFTLASSSKVSIMMAYLEWVESQGRGLTSAENNTITVMIEHSDNNAAQLLFDRMGGGPGMAAWMAKHGIPGYVQNPYGWGWAMLPPLSQVKILTMLQQGTILTQKDRDYALNLMRNIESDQRMGVGVTLPPGAKVAMKDGWVPEPDGLWAVNTSGIVTAGSETYIIVVYTEHQPNDLAGWAIAEHVCSQAGKLLVG